MAIAPAEPHAIGEASLLVTLDRLQAHRRQHPAQMTFDHIDARRRRVQAMADAVAIRDNVENHGRCLRQPGDPGQHRLNRTRGHVAGEAKLQRLQRAQPPVARTNRASQPTADQHGQSAKE